ncbi:TPA: hypothetical protein RUZ67_000314 [Klebsiella pneumoniae]|nr:hypothetical protein [Klebsiella pneumoniae]
MTNDVELIEKEYKELLDAALSNPGVADIMALFSQQQPVLNAHNNLMASISIPAQIAMSTGTIIHKQN